MPGLIYSYSRAHHEIMADTETTAAVEEVPDPNLVATLAEGVKLKRRKPRQRACNEPKGKKICAGHLKRWYEFGDEIRTHLGPADEIYRCERCRTLYLPNEEEVPRTGTLAY